MAKDEKDTKTVDFIDPGTRGVGRPSKYATVEEKKAVRAAAARLRRAKEREAGIIEVRIKKRVQSISKLPESDIIDLSAIGYSHK